MKTTRTYLSACNFCNAMGFVNNPNFGVSTGETKMRTCPVCNGAKTIVITETTEDDWLETIKEMTPKSIL